MGIERWLANDHYQWRVAAGTLSRAMTPTPSKAAIDLRLLGEADLRDPAGSPVTAVLRQPKRLALLAYLAAGDARFVPRDSLLAIFWPSLDLEHARAALRRALYFLRQALGDEVIESRGEDVGLSENLIRSDVEAFEAALAAGDAAAALGLYRGDLLPGFYVAEAPEAERWLDERRTHLRGRAAEAAWRLSTLTEDTLDAVRWARRAHALEPDDERGLRRLLQAFDRAGDRTGAIRAYEEFARRLMVDLELEPSPETVALVEAIRSLPVRTGERPLPSPVAAAEPSLIAVFPFLVRGGPDHAYLGEGMMDLLSTALNSAGAVRTVDPRTLLTRVGRDTAAGITPESARASSHELGAGRWLLGSVVAGGHRLRVQATLHVPGAEEARVDVEGTEDDLFALVDEVVRRLLTATGVAAGGRLAGLAPLTTSSMPALRHYLTGEHAFRLGRYIEALEAFAQAAEADPTFALAHYRLASASAAAVLIDAAQQASSAAYRHRERLTNHDRLLVEAQHAWLHGATGEAERRYGALLARHPDDMDAWFLLGDLLFHTNPSHGRSGVEAREPFERTLVLDPTHVGALVHLVRIDAIEGRWDDLDRRVDRILALSPDNDQALGMRALRAAALGRPEEEGAVAAMLPAARGLAIAIAFSDVALYANDLAAAERFGRHAIAVARSDEFRALAHLVLAHIRLARGEVPGAWEELAVAERYDAAWTLETRGFFAALSFVPLSREDREVVRTALREWDPSTVRPALTLPLSVHNALHPHLRHWLLGLLASRLGDAVALAEEAEALAELAVPAGEEVLLERLARTLEAEGHRLRGEHEAGLRALEGARTDLWFQNAVASPFHAGGYERWVRAELLEATGREREAAAWWGAIAERSPYEVVFRQEGRARREAILRRLGP